MTQTLEGLGHGVSQITPEPENELSVSEREPLKQLEQENRDLRMETELTWGKVTTFFGEEVPVSLIVRIHRFRKRYPSSS